VRQKRCYKKTADSKCGGSVAPDHFDQNFTTAASDQKWGAYISYIWSAEAWLYLSNVLDLFSRRIAG